MRSRALTALLAAAWAVSTLATDARAPAVRMRGVCWEARGEIAAEALDALLEVGVDWISETPFGWSPGLASPEIVVATPGRAYWGEGDVGLARTAGFARERGIRTLLKPHVWVRGRGWPGDLAMANEADWARWFAAYEEFILHYARLAEREKLDGLAVGTELCRASRREADWRRLIARVRAVYGGPLTYCANADEVERVAFWDALDFVGVQAYFPLGGAARPSLPELRAAWAPVVRRLRGLSRRTGKRVVFTEVGYKSLAGSLAAPWSWDVSGERDLELQRDAFRAMFESFWPSPWFGGAFVWKWRSGLSPSLLPPAPLDRDFTPQGKPALDVIRRYYRGDPASALALR
jgi:hypothetical protein